MESMTLASIKKALSTIEVERGKAWMASKEVQLKWHGLGSETNVRESTKVGGFPRPITPVFH